MGTNYNPRIVTDGLVLCLDAANPRSYPGTGTAWNDLSGNNNHFTLSGVDFVQSPNHFSFGDNEGDTIARSTTDVIGGLNTLSVEMILRVDVAQSSISFLSYATSAQNNEFLIFKNGESLYVYELGNAYSTSFSSSLYNAGNFINLTLTRSTNLHKFYLNGEFVVQFNGSSSSIASGGAIVFGQEQDSVLGGYATTQDFPGDIASVKIYNTALTDSQVKQNFEATRDRYGI